MLDTRSVTVMVSGQPRKKITWCAGLQPPCPIGIHPRVGHINLACVDGDIKTVARNFNVTEADLSMHMIETHHVPWEDSKVYERKQRLQDDDTADRDELLEHLEEFINVPHKYYPKMQKILTRIMVQRLAENAMADVTKLSKEIRENFRAMRELPISEDLEVNIQKEYDYFFNLFTMEGCDACQIKILAMLDEYQDENPTEEDLDIEEAQIEVKKAVTKKVMKKVDLRVKRIG
jgi:hypothetical protein